MKEAVINPEWERVAREGRLVGYLITDHGKIEIYDMTTKLGIKEQVKRGLLSALRAIELVDKKSKTYGWLSRRIQLKKP